MSLEPCGPDSLQTIADAELAAGNLVNYRTLQQQAKEWCHDLAELQRLQSQHEDLTFRFAEVQRAMA